jgi:hypothetical protein
VVAVALVLVAGCSEDNDPRFDADEAPDVVEDAVAAVTAVLEDGRPDGDDESLLDWLRAWVTCGDDAAGDEDLPDELAASSGVVVDEGDLAARAVAYDGAPVGFAVEAAAFDAAGACLEQVVADDLGVASSDVTAELAAGDGDLGDGSVELRLLVRSGGVDGRFEGRMAAVERQVIVATMASAVVEDVVDDALVAAVRSVEDAA